MVIKGKFFAHPPKDGRDIKELFSFALSAGIGLPVDSDSNPIGVWTAELIAQEISRVDSSGAGVDIRSVQHWLNQENTRGIDAHNIYCLSRIFGCGDPEATAEWRIELSAANRRLAEKRKDGQKKAGKRSSSSQGTGLTSTSSDKAVVSAKNRASTRRFSLAKATEALFCGSPLNLPASVFAGAVALGFTSYFLGIHEATFDAQNGQVKQVGFLWAPNWTFLFMAFMPLFFAFVSELLFFWKGEGRERVTAQGDIKINTEAWARNIEASTCTFWAILIICLLFAGVLQWVGVRLLPLVRGGGDYATDWGSLAIVRPEVISVPEAIVFTGSAFLYMCICFYLFFAALILLYSVVQDFGNAQPSTMDMTGAEHQIEVCQVGERVQRGIFRCTVLAIFIAMCMKLQSAYLSSSGTDILHWLINDIATILNATNKSGRLGDFSAPNHFSSLLIVLAAVFVFLYGAFRLDVGNRNQIVLWMMMATVGLLVAGYLLIGAFAGFSALLGLGVLLGIYALIVPGFRTEKRHELRDEQSVS